MGRNLKLLIEYDGTRYFGWQIQADRPTIQGTLEEALARIFNHPVRVHGAGRTDRGVHALGQVATVRTGCRIPAERLPLAVNTYLPRDIVVRGAEEMPPPFHARRCAAGKWYRYTIRNGRIPRVRERRFQALVPWPLDLARMRAAARSFLGTHDFGAFQTRSKRPPTPTVRTVYAVRIARDGERIDIDVVGRSFLYNMVRAMCGTLIDVGRGRTPVEAVPGIRDRGDRRLSGPTADPCGLCLMEVFYGEVPRRWREGPGSLGEGGERV